MKTVYQLEESGTGNAAGDLYSSFQKAWDSLILRMYKAKQEMFIPKKSNFRCEVDEHSYCCVAGNGIEITIWKRNVE